jgi:hypothetical protein
MTDVISSCLQIHITFPLLNIIKHATERLACNSVYDSAGCSHVSHSSILVFVLNWTLPPVFEGPESPETGISRTSGRCDRKHNRKQRTFCFWYDCYKGEQQLAESVTVSFSNILLLCVVCVSGKNSICVVRAIAQP